MSTLSQVILKGADASKPSPSIPGRLYFANDTGLIYRDNGSSWDNVTPSGMTNPMTTEGDLIVGGAVTGGVAAPTRLAAGTSGDVLTSNGPGAAPSWQAAGGGSGNATSIQSVPVSATAPTTGQVLEYDGTDWVPTTPSGGGGGFGGGEATLTAPVLSSFTQDNFGGSTSATTIMPGGSSAILLTDPGLSGNSNALRSLLVTIGAPSSSWTLTARLRVVSVLHQYCEFGLVLKDSVSGKYMQYGWGTDVGAIQQVNWNSATSFNSDSSVFSPSGYGFNVNDAWWQWKFDGTNLNYNYSKDGNYFVTLKQTAIGSIYLPNAPDHAGIGINVNNTAYPLNAPAMECFSFALTQP